MKLPLNQSGQALTVLLFFVVITLIITSATVILVILNSTGASKYEQSNMAYDVAEAGIENALMRLLRDPAYTGETLTVDSGVATISVNGTNPVIITSTGIFNNFRRQIRVVADTNSILSIGSWTEVF